MQKYYLGHNFVAAGKYRVKFRYVGTQLKAVTFGDTSPLTTYPVVFPAGYVPNSVVRSQMVDFKPTPTDHFVAQERWKPKPVSS